MTNSKGAGSGTRSDWATPWERFEAVNEVMKFEQDVCANAENRKLDNYISEVQNAFVTPWESPFYANFPWGRTYTKQTGLRPIHWIRRTLNQVEGGARGAIICPASVNAIWWHTAAKKAQAVLFLEGRVNYEHPDIKSSSCNFESCWIFYREPFNRSGIKKLSKLGLLMSRL